MKKLLLSFSALFFSLLALAQWNVSLTTPQGTDVTNGDVTINGTSDATAEADINFTNNLGNTINVKTKRIVNNAIEGSTNYFCWTLCYTPATEVSPDAEIIAPATTNDKFHGYLDPVGNTGTNSITYVFFDSNNPLDSVYVNVTYNISAASGIEDMNAGKNYFGSPYPHPAKSFTTFDYKLQNTNNKAELVIYNMLGSEIKIIPLREKQGKITLSTTDMEDGIYFYSYKINNKAVATKKFIVSR